MNPIIKYFIDIDNHRAFDGSYPYTHWFEGKQSINLLYVQRLCFAVDPEDNIYIKIPRNNVFHLLQDPNIWDKNGSKIDHFTYKDLNDHTLADDTYYALEKTTAGNIAVACCYIVCSSSVSLEARQQILFKNDRGDTQTIQIGADFYDEREELMININNQGTEFPEVIQRAIYDSNVHEEAKDNILMNRKYKELLMDYINILGTRGSYSSLINSLDWFGYGDAVKIKEYWKHNNGYNDYESSDIKMVLDNYLKNMLSKYTKTTYYGLYCACQQIDGYEKGMSAKDIYNFELINNYEKEDPEYNNYHVDGVIEHEDNVYIANKYEHDYQGGFIAEPVPALKAVSFKWSKEDMMIKMALLGNFFESYFMPIHLDLIHSTIENVVYTNAIKIDAGDSKISRDDYIIQNQSIDCSVKDGTVFTLSDNISAGADVDTPFANGSSEDYDSHIIFGVKDTSSIGQKLYDKSENIINLLGDGNKALLDTGFLYSGNQSSLSREATITDIINIDASKDAVISDAEQLMSTQGEVTLKNRNDNELKTIMLNLYHGPGVIVPFNIIIPVIPGDIIYKEEVNIGTEKDQKKEWSTKSFSHILRAQRDNIYDKDEKYSIRLSFNLLCTQDTDYEVIIACYSNSGQKYVKNVKFTVTDTKGSYLDLYRVKYKGNDEVPEGCLEANHYMFSHTRNADSSENFIPCYYTQYIPLTNDKNCRSIQLRDLLIMRGWCISEEENKTQIHTLDDFVDNAIAQIYYENIVNVYDSYMFDNSSDMLYYGIYLQTALLASRYVGSKWIEENEGDINKMFDNIKSYIDKIPDSSIQEIYNNLRNKFTDEPSIDFNPEDIKVKIFGNETFGDQEDGEGIYTRLQCIFTEIYNSEEEDISSETLDMLLNDTEDNKFNFRVIRAWMHTCNNYDLTNREQISNTSNTNDYYKYHIWVAKELSVNDVLYIDSKNQSITIPDEFLKLTTSTSSYPSYEFLTEHRNNSYERTGNIDIFGVQDVTSGLLKNTLRQYGIGDEFTNVTKYNFKGIIYRHEKIYFPQDHYLSPVDRSNILGLTVNPYETLAVIPHVKYLRDITDWEWNFYNSSTKQDNIIRSNDGKAASILEPFIASQKRGVLDPGYYDIIFRYRISTNPDKIHELTLRGAFIMNEMRDPVDIEIVDEDETGGETLEKTVENTDGIISYKFKYTPADYKEKISLDNITSDHFTISKTNKNLNGFDLIYTDLTSQIEDTITATFTVDNDKIEISKNIIIKYNNTHDISISGEKDIKIFDNEKKSYNYTFDGVPNNAKNIEIIVSNKGYENHIDITNETKKGFTITPNNNLLAAEKGGIQLSIKGKFNISGKAVYSKTFTVNIQYIEPLSIQLTYNDDKINNGDTIDIPANEQQFVKSFNIDYSPIGYSEYYEITDVTGKFDKYGDYIKFKHDKDKKTINISSDNFPESMGESLMTVDFNYKNIKTGNTFAKSITITLNIIPYIQANINITGETSVSCSFGDKKTLLYKVYITPNNHSETIKYSGNTLLENYNYYQYIDKIDTDHIDKPTGDDVHIFSITYKNNYGNTKYTNNHDGQINIDPELKFNWIASSSSRQARTISVTLPTNIIKLTAIPEIKSVTLTGDNSIVSDYARNGYAEISYKIPELSAEQSEYYTFDEVSDLKVYVGNDDIPEQNINHTNTGLNRIIKVTNMFGDLLGDTVTIYMNVKYRRKSDGAIISISTSKDYNLTYENVVEPFILYNTGSEDCTICMAKTSNTVNMNSMRYFVINNYDKSQTYCDGKSSLYTTWNFTNLSTPTVTIPPGSAIAIKYTSQSSLSSTDGEDYTYFKMDGGNMEAYGNIDVLTGYSVMHDYAYQHLFENCTVLTKSPELKTVNLSKGCYRSMFSGCTGLTTTPTLPATTLADYCYSSMFSGCTGLTENIGFTTETKLTTGCCSHMYENCTGLTTYNVLQSTALADYCYSHMFSGCTGLTTLVENGLIINASALASHCCSHMFENCTELTSIPRKVYISETSTLTDYCYEYMFYGCTKLELSNPFETTTAGLVKFDLDNPEECLLLSNNWKLTLKEHCCSHMFDNCTSIKYTPYLSADTLVNRCYEYMFNNCTSLRRAIIVSTNIDNSTTLTESICGWLDSITTTGTLLYAGAKDDGFNWVPGNSTDGGNYPTSWYPTQLILSSSSSSSSQGGSSSSSGSSGSGGGGGMDISMPVWGVGETPTLE